MATKKEDTEETLGDVMGDLLKLPSLPLFSALLKLLTMLADDGSVDGQRIARRLSKSARRLSKDDEIEKAVLLGFSSALRFGDRRRKMRKTPARRS